MTKVLVHGHNAQVLNTSKVNFATPRVTMSIAAGKRHITIAPTTNTVVLSALLSLTNLSSCGSC